MAAISEAKKKLSLKYGSSRKIKPTFFGEKISNSAKV